MKQINLKKAVSAYADILYYRNYHEKFPSQKDFTDRKISELSEVVDPVLSELSEQIDYCQRRCRERKLTGEDVLYWMITIEDELSIPKKYLDGVTVNVDQNAQSFPSAYKGRPESTQFCAEFKNGTWRVTDICRNYTRTSRRVIIHLTDGAKEALLRRHEYID